MSRSFSLLLVVVCSFAIGAAVHVVTCGVGKYCLPWSMFGGSDRSTLRVIDGDTVAMGQQGEVVRLVGFNTPEIGGHAQCPAERERGEAARDRLQDIVDQSPITVTLVRCACASGTQQMLSCNFGRSCGVLEVSGHNVADILISEGLAVPYHCSEDSCPPLRNPWCGE